MFSVDVKPAHNGGKLRVAHLLKEYLPYSCSWIFHQITGPKQVETLTIAWEGRAKSVQAFPNPGLIRLSHTHPLRYCLTRLLAPAGIRWLCLAARSALESFSP